MTNRIYIKRLIAQRVRNLHHVDVTFDSLLTVFYGDNGQGKTNLLEAISLGTCLKPLRPIKHLKDLIMFDHSDGAISLTLSCEDDFKVDVQLQEAGKKVFLSGKPIRDASQLSRLICVVTFVPDDLHMITGGGTFRRKAIDQLAYGLFPVYAEHSRRYEKALSQRNHLLKRHFYDPEELASFTQILVEAGAEVIRMRIEAIKMWHDTFQQALDQIAHGTLASTISYLSPATKDSDQNPADHLHQLYRDIHHEERLRRTTLAGPHLDDLAISLNGQPARHTASRGQSRALVLAFKIAQLKMVHAHRGISPLFLLDDVASELDPNNAQALLATVQELHAQTFVTTTHLETLPFSPAPGQTWQVMNGALTGYEEAHKIA